MVPDREEGFMAERRKMEKFKMAGFPLYTRETVTGCSVKSFSFFFAWISTIAAIGVTIFSMADLFEMLFSVRDNYRERYEGLSLPQDEKDLLINQAATREVLPLIIIVLVAVLYIVLSGLLMSGITRDKPRLMYPWIFVAAAYQSVYTFLMFFHAWDCGIDKMVFREIVVAVIQAYIFAVVYSYYVQLTIEVAKQQKDQTNSKVLKPSDDLSV